MCATPQPPSSPALSKTSEPSLSICHGPSCTPHGGGPFLQNILTVLVSLLPPPSRPTCVACGCLGHCSGAGYNVGAVSPSGRAAVLTDLRGVDGVLKSLRGAGVNLDEVDRGVVSALRAKEAGDIAFGEGRFDDALGRYEKALTGIGMDGAREVREARDGIRAGVLCNRSGLLLKMGIIEEALRDACEAVEIRPGLAAAWRRKGDAEEADGGDEKAASSLEMAAKLIGGPEGKGKRGEIEKRVKNLRKGRRGRWWVF